MDFINNHILSLVIFFPLAFSAVLLLIPRDERKALLAVGLLGSVIEFALSLHLYYHFQNTGSYEFMELMPWIERWKIQYFIGIDGVSLLLILLTTLLWPLVILSSFKSVESRVKEYLVSLFILQARCGRGRLVL